jgi:hypothetical protein
MDNIFEKDLIGKSGGILIIDEVSGEKVILLGKSNIPKRVDSYESFGGKYESYDLSSLHTALRELIEEFFNLKVSSQFINQLALEMRNSKYILKQHELNGMSYMINFEGFNFIFQKLCLLFEQLNNYNSNNNFNLKKYFLERKIHDSPSHGLNEIQSIDMFKLKDIKENKIKLRWFTNKIIKLMTN